MLLNRVKIIALCGGGWVMVAAAYMACELRLPTAHPQYKCKTEATNTIWVSAVQNIVVNITDPLWCPVVIDGVGNTKFQSYAANLRMNAAPLTPERRIDFTFANANGVSQGTDSRNFTVAQGVAYAVALGGYQAGTAGNVTLKRDYVKNKIYTVSGIATGDGWLDYLYHANPSMAGTTTQPNPTIVMTAHTPRIQQPATYQWFVGGTVQGPRTGSNNYYQKFTKIVSAVGNYTIKAVIIDKWNRTYTVSRTVSVTAVGCSGKIC